MKYYVFGLLFTLFSLNSCIKSGKSSTREQKDSSSKPETKQQAAPIIVDVRTAEEWDEGHNPCSVNFPLDQIESKADELRNYTQIIVICRSGHRAQQAKEKLESLGIKNIENKGSWQNITCP